MRTKVTSDAGLLAYRDLDKALGLFDRVPSVVQDLRTGRNIQHALPALLRQSVYSRLAGYEDVNDAHRLSVDPAMRRVTGKKNEDKKAASANTMGGRSTGENLSSTHHSGSGQFSQSCPWPAGGLCLQRSFWMHLLPSPVLFQPVRRLRRCNASPRQRSQRGSLEGATGTNRGSLREEESPQILSGGCRFRQAGDLMNAWRRRASCMPSGFRPMRCFRQRLKPC